MATVEELEERVREIENMLTLISREVIEQFDMEMKLKLIESYITREVDNKIELAQKDIMEKSQIRPLMKDAEEIKQMLKEIRTTLDTDDLRKAIKGLGGILKTFELRVSFLEKQFRKLP